MFVPPYSRRLRLYGTAIVTILVVAYVEFGVVRWRDRPLGYARDYYASVSSMLGVKETIFNNTLYQEGNEELVSKTHNFTNPCARFPDTSGILLVMKTGATEVFERVPTHIMTSLQCLDDFLIFSDMEQQVGRYHVYDVLSDVAETAKAHNADFDLYRDQKECPVSQKACVDAKTGNHKAWNLDKYKFLPMMEKTWKMRPHYDWYIFSEADTYIFWANMAHWLKTQSGLNPHEKLYLGSRSFIGGTPFAHGGSGYVISGTLLKHLIENHPGIVQQHNIKAATECCGDLMLAKALEDYESVKLSQAWPMFNGEKPASLPYGPGHWCEPILTMHHVNPEEVSHVWLFEQTRKSDHNLMMKDLYEGLIAPKMQETRQDWDNLSDDVCYINPDPQVQDRAPGQLRDRQKRLEDMNEIERDAWRSPNHCAKVCQTEDVPDDDEFEFRKVEEIRPRSLHRDPDASANALDTKKAEDTDPSDAAARQSWQKLMNERKKKRTCFQYRWFDEQCCTSRSFKLGFPKAAPPDHNEHVRWTSGWHLKGINDWIGAMGECREPAWKMELES